MSGIDGNFGDMLDPSGFDLNSMLDNVGSNDGDQGGDDGDKGAGEAAKEANDNDDLSVNSFFEGEPINDGDDADKNIDEDDTPGADSDSDTSSSNSAPSKFAEVLAKDLMSQGIISSLDDEAFTALVEEKGEVEALRSLITGEISNTSDTIKKDYDDNYQEYLSLVEDGVDKNMAGDLVKSKEVFSAITDEQISDEENSQLRRDILTENYKLTTKFTDARIKKLIDRSFELGEDVEETQEALTGIKESIDEKIESEKKDAVKFKADQDQAIEDSKKVLRDSIEGLNEIIPGQKINKQTKDKMYGLITKPVQDKNGNTTNALWAKRADDPVHFDHKLAYLVQTGFFEKGKSWDKVKNVKTTKEVSHLEEFLKTNSSSKSGRATSNMINKETSDILKSTASILR
jgi:hypothetical protein